jgi:hypothetical protein
MDVCRRMYSTFVCVHELLEHDEVIIKRWLNLEMWKWKKNIYSIPNNVTDLLFVVSVLEMNHLFELV